MDSGSQSVGLAKYLPLSRPKKWGKRGKKEGKSPDWSAYFCQSMAQAATFNENHQRNTTATQVEDIPLFRSSIRRTLE
jgi:hypothetical protein